MNACRILLQVAAICAVGLTLAILLARPSDGLTPALSLTVVVALLFAITIILPERPARAPDPRRTVRPLLATLLILLGASALAQGGSLLIGTEDLPTCDAACNAGAALLRLARQTLGETYARLLAFTLWSCLALFLCFLGLRLRATQDLSQTDSPERVIGNRRRRAIHRVGRANGITRAAVFWIKPRSRTLLKPTRHLITRKGDSTLA